MMIHDDPVMIYDVDDEDEDEDEEDNENPSAAGSGLRLSMIRTSPMLISLTSDLPSHRMHIQVHTGAYVCQ